MCLARGDVERNAPLRNFECVGREFEGLEINAPMTATFHDVDMTRFVIIGVEEKLEPALNQSSKVLA